MHLFVNTLILQLPVLIALSSLLFSSSLVALIFTRTVCNFLPTAPVIFTLSPRVLSVLSGHGHGWYSYRNPNIRVLRESERLLLTFREPSTNDGGVYTCRGKFQVTVPLEARVDVSFYREFLLYVLSVLKFLAAQLRSLKRLLFVPPMSRLKYATTWFKSGSFLLSLIPSSTVRVCPSTHSIVTD